MKRGKNISVKWKMVGMILLYWALPFVLIQETCDIFHLTCIPVHDRVSVLSVFQKHNKQFSTDRKTGNTC